MCVYGGQVKSAANRELCDAKFEIDRLKALLDDDQHREQRLKEQLEQRNASRDSVRVISERNATMFYLSHFLSWCECRWLLSCNENAMMSSQS